MREIRRRYGRDIRREYGRDVEFLVWAEAGPIDMSVTGCDDCHVAVPKWDFLAVTFSFRRIAGPISV